MIKLRRHSRLLATIVGSYLAFVFMNAIGWKYQQAEAYTSSAEALSHVNLPAPVNAKPVTELNPKVSAGLVQWHSSLERACAAAKASGKPVLLFEMLGSLDDEFC